MSWNRNRPIEITISKGMIFWKKKKNAVKVPNEFKQVQNSVNLRNIMVLALIIIINAKLLKLKHWTLFCSVFIEVSRST